MRKRSGERDTVRNALSLNAEDQSYLNAECIPDAEYDTHLGEARDRLGDESP